MAIACVQKHFRFRSDAGTVDATPTWMAAEDTNISISDLHSATVLRLRFEVQNTGSTTTGAIYWRLFASYNGGAYSQVTTATAPGAYNAGSSADNANLATRRLTTESGTWVAGDYDETGTTGTITLAATTVTELEFGIKLQEETFNVGDTIDFRVYRSTSTALNTYTVTPRITIVLPPPVDSDAWDIALNEGGFITYENGNKTAYAVPGVEIGMGATSLGRVVQTGKRYFECYLENTASTYLSLIIGFLPDGVDRMPNDVIQWYGYYGWVFQGNTLATIATFTDGDVLSCAIDFDAHLVWFRVNSGLWNSNMSADPATGTGGISFEAIAETYNP